MNYRIIKSDDYLAHYGVLGMKWGVRNYQNKDGSLTVEGKLRYSSDQYKRDKSVYGRSGANRIRKRIGKGESVSGARSREADRIGSARKSASIAGDIGQAVGRITGGITGAALGYQGAKIVSRITGTDPTLYGAMATSAIALGAQAVGSKLGRQIGATSIMAIYGYDPAKYRE